MAKRRRKEGPAAKRHRAFVRAHRIHYDDLLIFQGGKCPLCGTTPTEERRLDMDHNHVRMEMRGLLCSRCNRALGMLGGETDQAIEQAIIYLERIRALRKEVRSNGKR